MKKFTLQLSTAAILLFTGSNTLLSQSISFTTSPNNQCAPMVVTFTNTTTTPGAYRYEWSFGDGSPMLTNYTPTTFTHTYAAGGYYNPMVNVYDNSNNYLGYSYGSGSIQVNGASISSPDSACANDVINFCMNGPANSYSWNFGDGGTSTNGGCVNHSYVSVGTYTVTLVTNTSNCGTQTVTRKVVIGTNVKPNPNAWTNSNSTCPAVPMSFNTGTFSSYSWNFGDPGSGAANTSTLQYPSHLYGTVGTYTATVTVTNSCGKTGSATTTVSIVNNPPWPNQSWFQLDANGSPACPNSNVSFNAPWGYSSYEWNFGDGSPLTSTSNNYNNHTYGPLGKYTVSVKIPNGCGSDTTLYDTVRIINNAHFPNQSWFSIKNNPAVCPGSNPGFEAPGGFSSYVWNFGDGSPLYTTNNSQVGHQYSNTLATYTVSVKITNGCGNDSTLYSTLQVKNNVAFPTQDFQINGGPNPACPGDNVNWSAPSGYLNYKWTFGDGDTVSSKNNYVNHKYVSTGTYTITVKITNGCGKDTTISTTTTISNSGTFPNWLSIETTPSACPNDLLEMRFNQNGYAAYHWDFGDGNLVTSAGERIQHAYISTGTYTVTCQVTNGCGNSKTVSTTVTINNTSPVNSNLKISGFQNPSCPNDEVFFVISEGGQPNYKYYWNFGDSSAADTTEGSGSSHVYTSVGTYTVTVTATNGCGMTKNILVTQVVNNSSVPTLVNNEGKRNWGFPGSDESGTNNQTAGCKGDAIIFYFMGSAANNQWDFGDGNKETATESMLVYGGDGSFPVTIIKHAYSANGTYKIKLTITNNCGNSVTDSMMIVVGGGMAVNGDMTTSPPPFTTCAPIDFLAFGGSEYQYNFGDGSTLNTVSPTVTHTFASQGVYVISVLVTNGCGNTATYSRSINVNGVGGPAVSLTSSTNPTCVNDADGTAAVSVTSGQAPYIYLWDDANAQNTPTATGLSAGLYDVTVTDAMGCASTLAVQINNPAPIVLNVSTTTTACGGTTGTASVSAASGGTAPFIYLWSTGGTGASVSGLSAGAYSVTATDANGCTSFANVSISESGGATLSVASSTDVSCNGSANGAIDISVTGGTAPYVYLWSNGATTQDITGLSAGNYSVLVSDASACKATINKTITQPSVLATTTSVISPTCGNFDGTASVTASGGTGPYTYLWDPGAGSNVTTQSASGLPAGSYTVTVTDANGCSMDTEVSLSNSNAPNISSVITNVSCNGGSNGAIDITVTGGTSPYLYTWNVAPPNSQDKTNLAAGTYMVFVNDSKGCMSFRSYTVTQPDVLATSIIATAATCSSTNGTAMASTTGGNLPYAYVWSGAQTTQSVTGLSAGSYTVTVTDSKACTAKATSSIAVAAPTPSLCMVTVDSASINNIIYWDKTQYTHVDSFIVYREVSTNVYKRIAALKDTALSQYIDINRSVGPANGDPNVGAYRYKLQLRDSCGNYSALSPYHNTIYIIDAGSGQFDWNLPYTIEGGANPVANYNLICDLANTNSWFTTGSVAGTQSSATDPSFITRPGTARWRVTTDWSISCTPTRGVINTTRSNIKASAATTSILNKTAVNEILVYPNPATEAVTILYPAGFKKYQLQVLDALGQLVYNEELGAAGVSGGMAVKQLDVSTFRKGIYIINIQTEKGNTFKRLAIQ